MDQPASKTTSTSPANWSGEDIDYADCRSDLSECLPNLDEPVLKRPVRPVSNTSWSSSTHKHRSSHNPKRSLSTFATDQNVLDESPAPKSTKIVKVNPNPQLGRLAPFERAPAEVSPDYPTQDSSLPANLQFQVLQKIAAFACSDRDMTNMALLSKNIAYGILPADSTIWRTRLLAKYDHPIIPSALEFSLAYKLRRFVLDVRNFVNFKDNNDERLPIQMEVIRDLVIEAYHNSTPWNPSPQSSKNLQRMSSPSTSPWIKIFLSSPFYGYGSANFGHENALFEALQLTLSYLVLSPKSRVARTVQTSRDHYDIARVYNYNSPLTTLFARLPEPTHDHFLRPPTDFLSNMFPNLRYSGPSSNQRPGGIKYTVDLNTLLHIRNFWHRHLIDTQNTNNLNTESGERTYSSMAKALMRLGYTPKEWTASLQDPLGNLEAIKSGVWHGHYTCLQPWPKSARDLEETAAEYWEDVAPLKLDFKTSTDNSSFTWPPIFSSIPAFESTSPSGSQTSDRPTFYLRGIAPFINLEEAERRYQSRKYRSAPPPPPPSTSSKSRSKSSSSSSEKSMFLHHPFGSLRLRGIIHPIPSSLTPVPGFYRVIFILFRPQTHYLISAKLETSVSALGGKRVYAEDEMTKDHICALEDSYAGESNGQLYWPDIDYAYAYEGVIVPGGRLMMGVPNL
ncbi:hypothetical protein DV736_g3850, partial [Chaetothyriales sp. CBS 134916]